MNLLIHLMSEYYDIQQCRVIIEFEILSPYWGILLNEKFVLASEIKACKNSLSRKCHMLKSQRLLNMFNIVSALFIYID